jgi:hypothetical protein
MKTFVELNRSTCSWGYGVFFRRSQPLRATKGRGAQAGAGEAGGRDDIGGIGMSL